MCASLNERLGRRGVAAVEFALVLPVVLLLLVGVTELGRAWVQSLALQKSLVAGVGFAARSSLPLTSTASTNVDNLVKRGSLDGTAPLVLSKWSDPSASLTISTRTFTGAGATQQVIRGQASVPFDPLFPGLVAVAGLQAMRIEGAYELVHIGN